MKRGQTEQTASDRLTRFGHFVPVENGSFGAAHKLAVTRYWRRIEK